MVFNIGLITAAFLLPISLPVFVGGAVVSGIMATKGISQNGVYSDGKTLWVRGRVEGSNYSMYYASEDEVKSQPYGGPPPAAVVEQAMVALAAGSSAAAEQQGAGGAAVAH
jgi:hypothetical protein